MPSSKNLDHDQHEIAASKPIDQAPDLQLLIDSTPGLIHTSLPDGYLDFFNQTWLTYVGRPLEDLQGWKWTDYIHPDDVTRIVEEWRASLASGDPFLCETRVRRADGAYRWMLHHKLAVRDRSGKIIKWYGSSIDIEDRKRAEEALRLTSQDLQESKTRLEEAQRVTHVGYWEWETETGRVTWADETYRIYGIHPQECLLDFTAVREKIHGEDWEPVSRALEEALAGGRRFNTECRVLRPTGEIRVVHVQGDIKRDASGHPYKMFGTVQDITERKRAEEALQRSTQELLRREAYLAEAQRLSHTGSFGWKPDIGEIVWSDETYRIFEYDRAHKPTIDSVFQRIHPDDQPSSREILGKALQGGETSFDHTFRLLMPDGRVKQVHALHALQEASGNREFVGAVSDITERLNAEQKVREQEAELRQVLDFAPQLVAVFGPRRERLYINRVALEYLGISLEEWRQRDAGREAHPDDAARLIEHAEAAWSTGSPNELELRLRKADGSYRWFLARYNPVRDGDGDILRWYVACTDIDDRKKVEERLQAENVALREEINKSAMFEEIVGASPPLQTVLTQIGKVAPTSSTVLITGETGTGKELVARAIHRRSQRCSRPFVSVNCAAIPRDLIASELFGHEKGAFTGALQRRLGKFELADGGTIFLDEIGELPAEMQIALLRVLQEHEFERVGGNQSMRTDVRVIAATNRDLQAAISNDAFRSDLFYRLNVFPIEVPPLRKRKRDIPMLVEYFIDRFSRQVGKKIRSIDRKTLELVQAYPWPGNIRELQNVIERSVVLCETENLSVDESWLSQPSRAPGLTRPKLSRKTARQEKGIIEAVLAETMGRVSGPKGAAAKLDIPSTTLESRIKSLKINKHRFKTV